MDAESLARAREQFVANMDNINSHNARYERGDETYTMGQNNFTHLSEQEFADRYLIRRWFTQNTNNSNKIKKEENNQAIKKINKNITEGATSFF